MESLRPLLTRFVLFTSHAIIFVVNNTFNDPILIQFDEKIDIMYIKWFTIVNYMETTTDY